MKICIVGAGAIGGYMGARLALAGQQVTLIARGAHLQAIQERGLTLQSEDGTVEVARPANRSGSVSLKRLASPSNDFSAYR